MSPPLGYLLGESLECFRKGRPKSVLFSASLSILKVLALVCGSVWEVALSIRSLFRSFPFRLFSLKRYNHYRGYGYSCQHFYENNLNKIACINLGKFIDNESQNNFEVYLFGKILKSIDKTIDFNTYNRTQIFEINKDYMFINIFTMVVE